MKADWMRLIYRLTSVLTVTSDLVLYVMAQKTDPEFRHSPKGRSGVTISNIGNQKSINKSIWALSSLILLSMFSSVSVGLSAYAGELHASSQSQPKLVAPAASAHGQSSAKGLPEVNEEKIGGRMYQTSKILVHAKPDQVWRLLTDYDNAPTIFPCLKKCKVLKDKGTSKVVQHEVKPTGFPGSFEYVLEIKEVGNRSQEWHRLSGDFHEVEGFWKLDGSEDGNSTTVTYASYVNGGFFMPQPLIKRQVRQDIPSVMVALKNHAETSHQQIANVSQRLVK